MEVASEARGDAEDGGYYQEAPKKACRRGEPDCLSERKIAMWNVEVFLI